MDNVIKVIVIVLCVLAVWFFISIPAMIAKDRGISKANMATVRLLAILGLFFGITWIVALILACVYSPDVSVKPAVAAKRKTFDPVPESFMTDVEVERRLSQQNPEKCENCGAAIGTLETPRLWKDHVVCGACAEKLAKA